jgi:hypothetical protein
MAASDSRVPAQVAIQGDPTIGRAGFSSTQLAGTRRGLTIRTGTRVQLCCIEP